MKLAILILNLTLFAIEILNPTSKFVRTGTTLVPARSVFYQTVRGIKVHPAIRRKSVKEFRTGSHNPREIFQEKYSARKFTSHKATPLQLMTVSFFFDTSTLHAWEPLEPHSAFQENISPPPITA